MFTMVFRIRLFLSTTLKTLFRGTHCDAVAFDVLLTSQFHLPIGNIKLSPFLYHKFFKNTKRKIAVGIIFFKVKISSWYDFKFPKVLLLRLPYNSWLFILTWNHFFLSAYQLLRFTRPLDFFSIYWKLPFQ